MSIALQKVIADLEKQLESAIGDAEWHQKKMREWEVKIISLKETLADLRNVEAKV